MPPLWKEMKDGGFPEDSFKAGSQQKKDRVFIARARPDESYYPCRLQEGNSGTQLSYCGEILKKIQYQILCTDEGLFWSQINMGDELPKEALVTGKDEMGSPLYSARSATFGVGSYLDKYKIANFMKDGKDNEVKQGQIEILCFRDSGETVSIVAKYLYPIQAKITLPSLNMLKSLYGNS